MPRPPTWTTTWTFLTVCDTNSIFVRFFSSKKPQKTTISLLLSTLYQILDTIAVTAKTISRLNIQIVYFYTFPANNNSTRVRITYCTCTQEKLCFRIQSARLGRRFRPSVRWKRPKIRQCWALDFYFQQKIDHWKSVSKDYQHEKDP